MVSRCPLSGAPIAEIQFPRPSRAVPHLAGSGTMPSDRPRDPPGGGTRFEPGGLTAARKLMTAPTPKSDGNAAGAMGPRRSGGGHGPFASPDPNATRPSEDSHEREHAHELAHD